MTLRLLMPKSRLPANRVRPSLRRHAARVGFVAIVALLAWSTAGAAPAVSATNARIRLLPGDLPLAGYLELVNQGKKPLTLVGASSPVFKTIHMHLSTEQNGKSTMLMIEGIEMNPGETLHFTPGSYHLMLMQRVKPLQVDDLVPITLKFSGNQSLEVVFTVQGAGTQ